jgi:hypothetical protein
MRLKIRDLVATIVVAAIAVPYIGYLINREMPCGGWRRVCV